MPIEFVLKGMGAKYGTFIVEGMRVTCPDCGSIFTEETPPVQWEIGEPIDESTGPIPGSETD